MALTHFVTRQSANISDNYKFACFICGFNTQCDFLQLLLLATADCSSSGSSSWNVRRCVTAGWVPMLCGLRNYLHHVCALRLPMINQYFTNTSPQYLTRHILQIATSLLVIFSIFDFFHQKLPTLNCQRQRFPRVVLSHSPLLLSSSDLESQNFVVHLWACHLVKLEL